MGIETKIMITLISILWITFGYMVYKGINPLRDFMLKCAEITGESK